MPRSSESDPFGDPALPDQCHSGTTRRAALRQEGQAVVATQPIGLFDTIQHLIGLAEIIEELGADGQRPAQIEGVVAPAGMVIRGVDHPRGLLGVAEHPGR